MSKRAYFLRYLNIINKLKAKPYSSYDEIKSHIDKQLDFTQDDNLQIGFSKRTLQRDINEIRDMFGLDIEYSKQEKGYFISYNENNNTQRIIETYELLNSLNLAKDLSPYVYLEKHRPQGTEHLNGLLNAIKNNLQIKFTYQKFWEDESSKRHVEPYALKEFKSRWYLMAKEIDHSKTKSFALDRITDLQLTNKHFEYPKNFKLEETYKNCFGIISPNEPEPEDIILSFTPFQGKYIKTLPLHDTQEVIANNDKEVRIKLRLYLTHDLIMELLSFGDQMKVIQPKQLAKRLKTELEKVLKQY